MSDMVGCLWWFVVVFVVLRLLLWSLFFSCARGVLGSSFSKYYLAYCGYVVYVSTMATCCLRVWGLILVGPSQSNLTVRLVVPRVARTR